VEIQQSDSVSLSVQGSSLVQVHVDFLSLYEKKKQRKKTPRMDLHFSHAKKQKKKEKKGRWLNAIGCFFRERFVCESGE
jgi:hypothetical protein